MEQQKVFARCMKCKQEREMKNPQEKIMKNGMKAMFGPCFVCATNMYRIVGKA